MTVAVRPQPLAAIIVRETTRIRDAYSSFPTQNSSYGLTPLKTVALDRKRGSLPLHWKERQAIVGARQGGDYDYVPCVDSRRAFALNKRVRKLGGFAHNKLSPGHELAGAFHSRGGRQWPADATV